jgi:hypothetical protein
MKHREFTTRTELKSLTRSIKCAEMECGSIRLLSECFRGFLHAPRGLFYSPKAARSRWRPTRKAILALCGVAHRTVRCTTGQPLFMSGAWSPSYSGAADRCNSGLVGAPLVRATRRPRIVRLTVALAAVGSSDSPVNYSRTPPNFPESGLFTGVQLSTPDTIRCTTGKSGVPD